MVATAVLVVLARLVDVVPPAMVVDVVQAGMGDTIWLSPGSPTAPGPGRSPAPSTVGLKVGGMQKTLTSVEAWVAPSSMHTPAGDPLEVMVRAGPCPNAPEFRWRHFVLGATVHWLSLVQGTAGGPWKLGENCCPQNPQKTNGCAERSAAVMLCVAVESANGIGRLPMNAAEVGGQSWLVG